MENELHDLLYRFINEYADELDDARKTENYKRPFGNLVRKDIVKKLRDFIGDETYYVKGSVGAGRWTDVPWIAVFDTRLTKSAQKGVYIVYLLNKDTKQLYLTFNQGATDAAQDGKLIFTGIASSSKETTLNKLKERAGKIREHLRISLPNIINSGSPVYDAGCICSKVYSLDQVPVDEILYTDLQGFLSFYKKYYDTVFNPEEKHSQEDEMEEHYIEEEGESEVILSVKEEIDNIESYISAKGFTYPSGMIENFYLSLKSKPFVILAGTSGTGKTRLVRLFAEAIGATAENGRYKLVSVRPDWSDSSDLFGHVNLKGEFVPGAIIDFVKAAADHTDKPYFLCLDEMNLARVEYYLSDFLSIIETRHHAGAEIVTDEVILDSAASKRYGKLIVPENLYVVGTVNMDETTFPFSKKVLDRANTIEFSYVDLEPDFSDSSADSEPEPLSLDNDFLKTEYLILKTDIHVADRELATGVCSELQSINQILLEANAHVGYRVRDEIVFYMVNNNVSGLLEYNAALDNEIMQKILPRIQGSSASVKTMLCELFKKCAGDYTGLSQASVSEQMREYIDNKECIYRKSAEKISYMMRRYEEDGFTSYWL